MDVLQFIKWCNNVRTTENLLLWRQKYKSVFRTMWANYPSLFWLQDEVVPFLQCGCYLMWGYCFVIRFVWQKMEKKTNEKNLSTLPVSYFLFTVRHNKWLVSIPPENNITPAVAFCPCLPCLPPPVFSFSLHLFFSEHVVTGRHSPPHPTYTHLPPFTPILTLSVPSVWNTLLSLVPTLSPLLHRQHSASSPTEQREANIILAEEQVRVKRRPWPSLSGIKGKELGEAGDKDRACLKFWHLSAIK